MVRSDMILSLGCKSTLKKHGPPDKLCRMFSREAVADSDLFVHRRTQIILEDDIP